MNEEDDNSQEFYKFIVAFGAKEGKEIKELSKKFGDGELTTMVFRLFMFAKILANSWDADQEFLILDTNKIKMYEQKETGEIILIGNKDNIKFMNQEIKNLTDFKEEIKWSNNWGAKPSEPFLA
jgi:hypothetical protein